MKLKQYLKEYQDDHKNPTRVKPISEDEVIKLLKTKASKAWKQFMDKGTHIERYSGYARSTKYGFLDTSKLPPRLSRNTENYYTHIINNDPSWSKFPKRQVIGLLRKRTSDYTSSGVFKIFPFNSTKVGIAPANDMWMSFPKVRDASAYNRLINRLLGGAYDNSLKEFKDRAKHFDREIELSTGGIEYTKQQLLDEGQKWQAKTLDSYDGDLYKNILDNYSPKGFRIGKPGSLSGQDNSEVWFDGPAVLINSEEIYDIEQRMEEEEGA